MQAPMYKSPYLNSNRFISRARRINLCKKVLAEQCPTLTGIRLSRPLMDISKTLRHACLLMKQKKIKLSSLKHSRRCLCIHRKTTKNSLRIFNFRIIVAHRKLIRRKSQPRRVMRLTLHKSTLLKRIPKKQE